MAYLSLCEVQIDGDLVATKPGQVVVVGELSFQLSQLLFGEGCAFLPGFAAGIHLKTGVLDVWREMQLIHSEVPFNYDFKGSYKHIKPHQTKLI